MVHTTTNPNHALLLYGRLVQYLHLYTITEVLVNVVFGAPFRHARKSFEDLKESCDALNNRKSLPRLLMAISVCLVQYDASPRQLEHT